MAEKEYSIVIPVYSAENALEKLHESICTYFDNIQASYEIIYVDDYSPDNSWEVLKKIRQKHSNTTIIRMSKNFGQHGATICGFKYAKGNFVITLDDDLEVHPREIGKLVEMQKKTGADVVYGEYRKLNRSFLRSFFTGIYKSLSKIEDKGKGKGSSFRLIKSALTRKLSANHRHFVFIDELLLWYTRNMKFVPVPANPDYIEKKRYKMSSLFSLASNIILFSSTFPLKFVTRIGFLLFSINFLVGIYYLVKKFMLRIEVPGYTSLIVSILFSTGLIIFCIGILAQYISQSIKAINNLPAYNEGEVIC
jgi:glycosyltransferase involved in cell wall biosynthesis